jgi:hypothetical protein
MLRLFLVLSVLASQTLIAGEVRDIVYQGNLTPRNITPSFDKGYLLVYEGGAEISVYGPSGNLLSHAVASMPRAKYVIVENAAADVDGTVVSAVEFRIDNRRRGGLVLFSPTGQQKSLVETGDYLPTQVDFGPDHSIWTLGWTATSRESNPREYSVLRNYTPQGTVLGEFLPRSTFEPGPEPVVPIVGGWQLRVTSRGAGAVFYASSRRQSREILWVEVNLKGKVLGRWNLPPKHIAAYTDDGTVYSVDTTGMSVLDATTSTWRSVPTISGGPLLGAEGADLVFLVSGNTVRRTSTLR